MSFDSCVLCSRISLMCATCVAVKDDDADERRREHDDADEQLPLPLLASLRRLYRQQVDLDHSKLVPGRSEREPQRHHRLGRRGCAKTPDRCSSRELAERLHDLDRHARALLDRGEQRRHPRRPARQVDLARSSCRDATPGRSRSTSGTRRPSATRSSAGCARRRPSASPSVKATLSASASSPDTPRWRLMSSVNELPPVVTSRVKADVPPANDVDVARATRRR